MAEYEDSYVFRCVRAGGPTSIEFDAILETQKTIYDWIYSSKSWGEPRKNPFKHRIEIRRLVADAACLPKETLPGLNIAPEEYDKYSNPKTQPIFRSEEPSRGNIKAEVIFLNGQPYYAAHFYASEPHDTCPVAAWYTENYDSVFGWKSVNSPNIISTYYADEYNIKCRFGSVAEHPAQIIKITKEIAEAMSGAHGKGFIDGCHHTCR